MSGTLAEQYALDPYGKRFAAERVNTDGTLTTLDPLTGAATLLTRNGLFLNPHTGNLENRARTLNARLFRMNQRDPKDTASILVDALLKNAQTTKFVARLVGQGQFVDGLGLYQYVRSNPINYLDPSGLDAWADSAYWATGGRDSWFGRFLDSDDSQTVADVSGFVGSAILLFTPAGYGTTIAGYLSRTEKTFSAIPLIGNTKPVKAFANAIYAVSTRFEGIHSWTKGAVKFGLGVGVAMGLYDGATNQQTGNVSFVAGAYSIETGITAILTRALWRSKEMGIPNRIAVGFAGIGGFFVGHQVGRAVGQAAGSVAQAIGSATSALIDEIYGEDWTRPHS